MSLTSLNTLINASAQNTSQFKGLSAAYGILLGGTPSIDGYTALINANNSSNFGAGGTTVFNDENIYINTINALYQGNPTAKASFDAIVSSAATIQDALTLVYNYVIPASARTEAGLNFFKSQAGFYAARAAELGVSGTNGTALVAFASLTKIAVDNDIGGLGDTINDLRAAVNNGTAQIPQGGTAFTPLETADGTQFDPDDVAGGANQGTTFSLTTGPDNYVGTAGNDTINGLIGTGATLSAADTINGGAGDDTLNVTYANADGNKDGLAGALISNVEFVNVRNTNATGANAVTIAATGLKGVSASGAGDVTVTALANNASFTANGTTGGALTAGYAAAATTAALSFIGATTDAVTVSGTALTTANITTSGAASTVASLTSAETTLKTFNISAGSNLTVTGGIATAGTTGTLNVSGAAASVNVGTLDTDFTTVNAAGLTAGGLTATMSTTATTVLTGGAGNDVITTGVALTTGKADAGAGTADRLVVANSAHLNTAALGAKYTNFEQLQVQDGVSVDLDNISGITSIRINDAGGATAVTNLSAAQAGAITVVAANATGAITIGVKGAATPGQIDTVALTIDDGATTVGNLTLGTPVIAGVEKLSINAVDNYTIAALTGAPNLDTITLTGAATQGITTGANSVINFSINGSAATGALTLNATDYATNGVALTGGSANDALTGSAQADTLTGGAGNDTISGLAGNDTISGGDGNDNITGGAGVDNLTGGAGTDTFVYTTLTDSRASVGPDRITDFVAGTDKIDVGTVPAVVLQGASYTAAGTGTLATDIANALTAGGGTLSANAVAVVTITGTGAGTYLLINDGTAGFADADDAVVNITGVTGTLAIADFV